MPISLPSELAAQVDQAARTESMTRSEYIRSLIRRQVAFSALRELQEESSKRSKTAGVRNLRDAVKVVRTLRSQ